MKQTEGKYGKNKGEEKQNIEISKAKDKMDEKMNKTNPKNNTTAEPSEAPSAEPSAEPVNGTKLADVVKIGDYVNYNAGEKNGECAMLIKQVELLNYLQMVQ